MDVRVEFFYFTCFLPHPVCFKLTEMLLTQSKWFNNSCEGRKRGKSGIKEPGADTAAGGKKKIRKENKVSGPIECGSGLSPDSCSVHYYVSKETDNSSYTHTRTRTHSNTRERFNLAN